MSLHLKVKPKSSPLGSLREPGLLLLELQQVAACGILVHRRVVELGLERRNLLVDAAQLPMRPFRNAEAAAELLEGCRAHAKLLRHGVQRQVELISQLLLRYCDSWANEFGRMPRQLLQVLCLSHRPFV